MSEPDAIVDRIKQQIEKARSEFKSARVELDNIIECFICDIRDNMEFYISTNLRREIRKKPALIEILNEENFPVLQAEIAEAVAAEISNVIAGLRDYSGWYKDEVVFLDTSTSPWKTVKSIETPVNRILKKNNLSPIDMKNWNWLSVETNELVTTRFAEIKKNFIDKEKQLKYLASRYDEEVRIKNAMEKLENM